MQLDPIQLEAVNFAVGNKFSIITGGAGTGKTTIIKEIASKLPSRSLCAFAGKAAARLKEATGYNATTIHRLLLSNGEMFRLPHLNGRSVVIDEASMVASDLLAEIIKRNPARLILVGDQAQLPPVGKGQPFHDLLSVRPDLVKQLTKCYRNSEAIYKAAMKIRVGEMPMERDTTANEHWEIVRSGSPEDTHHVLLDYVKRGEIDFEQDIVLCPRNGESEDHKCTVKSLNRDICALVNPHIDGERLKEGDRVINGKNFSDLDVWNGTTGTIHAIDDAGHIFIKLDIPIIDQELTTDRLNPVLKDIVRLDSKQAKSLSPAYALTVHKSQGSQYRRVFFVALQRDTYSLLDRSLIYTAVTRAREECRVMGQIQALRTGISNCTDKQTVIQELAKVG